jgi:hypothetical protein
MWIWEIETEKGYNLDKPLEKLEEMDWTQLHDKSSHLKGPYESIYHNQAILDCHSNSRYQYGGAFSLFNLSANTPKHQFKYRIEEDNH